MKLFKSYTFSTVQHLNNSSADYSMYLQGAPIKNNPVGKMLYFSHGNMDLSQTVKFLCESSHKIFSKFY